MMQYAVKVAISALLIVLIAELAKRSTILGAALASVPIVSVLAIIWLYIDTGDRVKIASLSGDIFWLVIPSLVLFLTLPVLLKAGWNFWLALGVGILLTAVSYAVTLWALAWVQAR